MHKSVIVFLLLVVFGPNQGHAVTNNITGFEPLAFVQETQKKAKKITKAQAARQATKAKPGKVLKVESKGNYYRVKVHQSSGRVVFVMVDAQTGKVRS